MIEVTRRSVLAMLAGGAASTGVAYAAVSSFSDEDLIRVTLEKYLGRLNIRKEHLEQFALEFRKRNPWIFPSERLSNAITLLETAKLGHARELLPRRKRRDLRHFDRWLVAEFHTLTDYAWRSSPNDPIRFTAWQSCTNPFATLDPPQSA